jgi:hypothetical protein
MPVEHKQKHLCHKMVDEATVGIFVMTVRSSVPVVILGQNLNDHFWLPIDIFLLGR